MDIQELQTKSPAELQRIAQELHQQLLKARFHVASRQATNTSQQKKFKRDLARIETLLSRPAQSPTLL